MAGRYERISGHDEEVAATSHPMPSSPPPSFHSRSSSLIRQPGVDPDLADAFDDIDDDADAEPDDRQRLVNATGSCENTISLEASGRTGGAAGIAATGTASRIIGGGMGTDGVFANMSARPDRQDSEKEELPPTYEQAAADSAPPYWETTILAPGLGGPDEVFVDGLPVGSVFSFIWNGAISTSFQLVGFLLTYLLHSSHAAKNGSRAGLGVTLIQYGFYMMDIGESEPPAMNGPDGYAAPPDPNSHNFDAGDLTDTAGKGGLGSIKGSDWMAYMLMVVGWFVLIKSAADFLKARRHEQLVLQSPDRGLSVPIIAEGEATEQVV